MDSFFQADPVYSLSAFFSAGSWVLTLITGSLFFYSHERWGKINDIASVLFLLCTIPLMLLLYSLFPSTNQVFRIVIPLIAIAGLMLPVVGQTLLIFGRIDFEGSTKYFPGFAGLGLWLVIFHHFLILDGLAYPLFNWTGILAGGGIILTLIFFLLKKIQNVLFYIGAGLFVVGYPIWAFMLGYLQLQGGFS